MHLQNIMSLLSTGSNKAKKLLRRQHLKHNVSHNGSLTDHVSIHSQTDALPHSALAGSKMSLAVHGFDKTAYHNNKFTTDMKLGIFITADYTLMPSVFLVWLSIDTTRLCDLAVTNVGTDGQHS